MSKGTTTTTQEAQVPEYLQSLFTEYAQRAKEASDIPFVGYTGDRIAGLSPEEAQAQAAAQGLFGTAFGFDPTAQLQTLAGQAIPHSSRRTIFIRCRFRCISITVSTTSY
jgi:hypothetical protein